MPKNHSIVGYLGPAGTHTHVAAMRIFGAVDQFGFQYRPLKSLDAILHAVADGDVGWGVAPYFNTTSGVVRATCPAVIDVQRSHFANLEVCLSIAVRITHDLLSNSVDAPQKIYSKREAYEQCRQTLAAAYPLHQFEEADSTAAAARRAERDSGPAAALASQQLLPFHRELQLLRDAVQDAKMNVTRFMVVRRRPASPTAAAMSLPQRTWLVITNTEQRSTLAKLLATAERWGLATSALSGAITDPETGAMRFLVELDDGINAWKTQYFLSEAAYLEPVLVGSPVVLERKRLDDARRWSQYQAIQAHLTERAGRSPTVPKALTERVQLSLASLSEYRLFIHPKVGSMESVWEYLGVEPVRMLNTQICIHPQTRALLFCVLRGNDRLDLRKVQCLVGADWRRASRKEVRGADQTLGAISPLTVPADSRVIVDDAVPNDGWLFVGSGDPTVSICLRANEPVIAAWERADLRERRSSDEPGAMSG